jgi:hypothetical protein
MFDTWTNTVGTNPNQLPTLTRGFTHSQARLERGIEGRDTALVVLSINAQRTVATFPRLRELARIAERMGVTRAEIAEFVPGLDF